MDEEDWLRSQNAPAPGCAECGQSSRGASTLCSRAPSSLAALAKAQHDQTQKHYSPERFEAEVLALLEAAAASSSMRGFPGAVKPHDSENSRPLTTEPSVKSRFGVGGPFLVSNPPVKLSQQNGRSRMSHKTAHYRPPPWGKPISTELLLSKAISSMA